MKHDFLPKVLLKPIQKNCYVLLELYRQQSRSFGTVLKVDGCFKQRIIFYWNQYHVNAEIPASTIPFQNVFGRAGPSKWQSGSILISCLVCKYAWKTLWNA